MRSLIGITNNSMYRQGTFTFKANLQSQSLKAKYLDQIEWNKAQVVKCEPHSQSKTTSVEPNTAYKTDIIRMSINYWCDDLWSAVKAPLPDKEAKRDDREDKNNHINQEQQKICPWKDLTSLH